MSWRRACNIILADRDGPLSIATAAGSQEIRRIKTCLARKNARPSLHHRLIALAASTLARCKARSYQSATAMLSFRQRGEDACGESESSPEVKRLVLCALERAGAPQKPATWPKHPMSSTVVDDRSLLPL